MGREIRRVPLDYKHPRLKGGPRRGEYKSLFDGSDRWGHPLSAWQRSWDEQEAAWQRGEHPDQLRWPDETRKLKSFAQWDGPRPHERDHTPELPLDQRPGWCYYESTSEGTPLSPVFATPEELARWMSEHEHSDGWSAEGYEAALAYVTQPPERHIDPDWWKTKGDK